MILQIVFLVFWIVLLCTKFYEIYKIHKKNKESKKTRENFEKYLECRKKYAEEISDYSMKREFMMETASFLENVLNDMTLYNDFNYEEKMEEMALKWKDHIPELKQKFRQNQLNKLI
jgi:hypothetical protein